jgi:hypothetical protein
MMNSDSNPIISANMRKLIISYMEACNDGQTDLADSLMEKIKEEKENDAG